MTQKTETRQAINSEMEVGFFSPNYFEYPTLYFYGNVKLEKGLTEHILVDSVVFTKDQHNNPTTSYAPPWLYPQHLKLDYGIIIFKVLGLGHDFATIIDTAVSPVKFTTVLCNHSLLKKIGCMYDW